MKKENYIDVTQAAGKAFYLRQIQGNVVMLNLLKFNAIADYTQLKELAPANEISGRAAYQLYMNHTLPFLKEAGGEVIFFGKGGPFLIGPEAEIWDAVLLVRHESTAKFMAFATNPGYLEGVGHRTAALEDARLLPIEEKSFL